MNFTLNELAEILENSEDPAMGLLKQALLRDTLPPDVELGTLTLDSPQAVAHFLALTAVLASESNGKDTLRTLKAEYSGAELNEKFQQCGNANPLQKLKTAKGGEFVLDAKEKLPVFELDGKKLSPLLRSPSDAFAAAARVGLGQLASSAALTEAFASQVSHPTKLSAPAGKGGFLKMTSIQMPADFPSVTEEDFQTRETVTLACSAGYQKLWTLLLPLFLFEGKRVRLAALLGARPDIAEKVSGVLLEQGVAEGPTLVAALSSSAPVKVWGEPQVFCGDLPRTERLSVIAPYGLFNEITRAKRTLQAEFESDRVAEAQLVENEIEQLQAAHDSLGAADTSKVDKKQSQLGKKTISEKIKTLKADKKKLTSAWLSIPFFPLMFGGANPRNLAMDLDTSIHGANVQVRVPRPAKQVIALSGKAFFNAALVITPRLRKRAALPCHLKADTRGAALTRARQDFFADLIYQSMVPLQQMREAWVARSRALVGDATLSQDALAKIESSREPWALFVKGTGSANNKDAMASLEPLVHVIAKAARAALQHAFGDEFPSIFDSELLPLSREAVALERA